MARARNIKNSLITLNPSFFLHLLSVSPFRSLILSPKAKRSPRNHHRLCSTPNLSLSFLSLLIFFTLVGFLTLSFVPISRNPVPCSAISPSPFNFFSSSPSHSPLLLASLSTLVSDGTQDEPTLLKSSMVPLPAHGVAGNASEEEKEFWQQPDSEDYRPCLDFSIDYRRKSKKISKEKKRFLMVVVSGGLNQQRNQIVDAVVIARILEAALVVPVLQVNHIWRDER